MEGLGLPQGGGECLVRRTVGRGGRGKVFINGSLSTVAILQQLSKGLVDLSGQHHQVTLLDSRTHLPQLDAFASLEPLVAAYRDSWSELRRIRSALESLEVNESTRKHRSDLLSFQVRELETLAAASGEEKKLGDLRRRLAGAAKLAEPTAAANEQLSGDGGARDPVASVLVRLREAAALDASLGNILCMVESAVTELDEAGRDLAARSTSMEDPEQLEQVEERLEAIRAVARKHNVVSDQLPNLLEQLRLELGALESDANNRTQMEAEVKMAEARTRGAGARLTEARTRAARKFAALMVSELTRLAMERTRVSLELRPCELGPSGADEGQLLISANPGEPLRPLADIASGGELSRVLLALKRVLARSEPGRTHVFDEIDAGIGGTAADAVGQMLHEVAKTTQVICVTHLPQNCRVR